MLLAVDIGNSNTKFGVFDGEHLLSKYTVQTNSGIFAAEMKRELGGKLELPLTNAIVCSVVPNACDAVTSFLQAEIDITPTVVSNDLDFGIEIDYQPLASLGADRLVNSFAAAEKYGVPCIVCSLGTATTLDVIDRDRRMVGGMIAPGISMMAKAIHLNTAQLPEVKTSKPEKVLANTTVTSIRSGLFYGYIAMVEGLIKRIQENIGAKQTVVATGGMASLVAENTPLIDVVDEDLTLDGLRLLYKRIHPA